MRELGPMSVRFLGNCSHICMQRQTMIKSVSEREREIILSFRDLIKMSARAWHKNWVMGVKSEPKFRLLDELKLQQLLSCLAREREYIGEWAAARLCLKLRAGATPAARRHKAVIKFLDVPSAKRNAQMSGGEDTEICCWLIEK